MQVARWGLATSNFQPTTIAYGLTKFYFCDLKCIFSSEKPYILNIIDFNTV